MLRSGKCALKRAQVRQFHTVLSQYGKFQSEHNGADRYAERVRGSPIWRPNFLAVSKPRQLRNRCFGLETAL